MENIQLETCWDVTIQDKLIDSVSLGYIKAGLDLVDEQRFIDLDEFVKADKTSILTRSEHNDKDTEYCELDLSINPKFELDSFSLVSDCKVIEIFNGSIKEFYKTCNGTIIDDFDEPKSYRYDVCCKNVSNKITIRLITKSDEIWIFGIQLQLLESSRIKYNQNNIFDLEAIQKMIVNSKGVSDASGTSDKCKVFFDSFLNTNSKKSQIVDKTSTEIDELKKHIDLKLLEVEKNLTKTLNERIDKIEYDLTEKLNNLIFLIKKQNE